MKSYVTTLTKNCAVCWLAKETQRREKRNLEIEIYFPDISKWYRKIRKCCINYVELNKIYIYKILYSRFYFISSHRSQSQLSMWVHVWNVPFTQCHIYFRAFHRNPIQTTSHKMGWTFIELRLDNLCRISVLYRDMPGIFCALYMLL